MKTAQSAARALAHPLSLTCIGLLLFNDHFLKAAYPSFLTGKLSDFAGLFFFPFLLILVVSFPLTQLGLSPDRITAAAYSLTFAWFAGFKTLSVINNWTEQVAGFLRGSSVHIVQDPTDLLALLVLFPSWLLWQKIAQTPSKRISKNVIAAAVIAAFLGTIATTPCIPDSSLTRLVFYKGNIYGNFEATPGWYDRQVIVTVDSGANWIRTPNIPEEIDGILAERQTYPEIVCLESYPQRCYRINGGNQIERTDNGGKTWTVDWEISPARQEFMLRYDNGFLRCEAKPDFQIFDLDLYEDESDTKIVAAMGNEGMLIKINNSDWERRDVLDSFLTPIAEFNIVGLFFLFYREIGISMVLGVVAVLILSAVVRKQAEIRLRDPLKIGLAGRMVRRMVISGVLVYWAGLAGWATGIIAWLWVAEIIITFGICITVFLGLRNVQTLFYASAQELPKINPNRDE